MRGWGVRIREPAVSGATSQPQDRRERRFPDAPDRAGQDRSARPRAGARYALLARSETRRTVPVKLLRTIALDPSDTFVFDVAAEPGDWAVSGAFRFCDRDPARLMGKDRSAFRSGFLGAQSWGWSTLVQIVGATAADRRALVELLAALLVEP